MKKSKEKQREEHRSEQIKQVMKKKKKREPEFYDPKEILPQERNREQKIAAETRKSIVHDENVRKYRRKKNYRK